MVMASQLAISNSKSRSAFVIAQFLFLLPHPQIEAGSVGSALASSAMVDDALG
jgi:hypothetical protein